MVKFVNAVQTTDTSNLVKKADYDIKLAKLNRKYLMMINILLLLSLISYRFWWIKKKRWWKTYRGQKGTRSAIRISKTNIDKRL